MNTRKDETLVINLMQDDRNIRIVINNTPSYTRVSTRSPSPTPEMIISESTPQITPPNKSKNTFPITPYDVSPLPCHVQRFSARRGSADVITSSNFKRKLIENQKKTKKPKKNIQKSIKKLTKTKKSIDICNKEVECECVICGSTIYDGALDEESIQCTKCKLWCHEKCIHDVNTFTICDLCT